MGPFGIGLITATTAGGAALGFSKDLDKAKESIKNREQQLNQLKESSKKADAAYIRALTKF